MMKLTHGKVKVTQVESDGWMCKILLDYREGRTSSAGGG